MLNPTPTRTSSPLKRRERRLLTSCAIGLALVAIARSPEARAQKAFQGTGTVVGGSATITQNSAANQDRITVFSNTAVINWDTDDRGTTGGAIDFLPSGSTAVFARDGTSFTVLNRILPNGARPIALNGNVIALANNVVGGNVWFFSPNGVIAGAGSAFAVGGLVLTANDIPFTTGPSGGITFGPNGEIQFRSAADSTAEVRIDAGSTIIANSAAGNNYVIAVAPRVVKAGNIAVNGSAAFLAAEAVDVTINNGLFDINFITGTTVPDALVHSGITVGAGSAGVGDVQRIYMGAMAKNTAVTMLVGGTVDAFASGAVADDGAIVLTGGYDLDKGEIVGAAQGGAVNLDIREGSFRSDVVARASGNLTARPGAAFNTLNFEENATLQGDVSAAVTGDGTLLVGGSLAVLSRSATVSVLEPESGYGGLLDVTGNLTIDASTTGAIDLGPTGTGGNATGGSALLRVDGGVLNVAGETNVRANGAGGFGTLNAGDGRGGIAGFEIANGGDANLGALTVAAIGFGGVLPNGPAPVNGGDGSGGTASITVGGGTLDTTSVVVSAEAFGSSGDRNLSGNAGGDATGGNAAVISQGGAAFGSLAINAGATAGFAGANGAGGDGAGGVASLTATEGLTSMGTLTLDVRSNGGAAGTGGIDGSANGANARAEVVSSGVGTIVNIVGTTGINASAVGVAGGASGGAITAGAATIEARTGSTLTLTDTLTVAATASGTSAARIDAPDATGDAVGGTIRVGSTGGTLNLLTTDLDASAVGFAATTNPGDGTGGTITVFSDELAGQEGFTQFTGGALIMAADGTGGAGLNGGVGTGGTITASANGGTLIFPTVAFVSATGFAGRSGVGGAPANGTGGTIRFFTDDALAGSQIVIGSVSGSADGDAEFFSETGYGVDSTGDGGVGTGGTIEIDIEGGSLTGGTLSLGASGRGGGAAASTSLATRFRAGAGIGGGIAVDVTGGTISLSSLFLTSAGAGGTATFPTEAAPVAGLAAEGRGGAVTMTVDGGSVSLSSASLRSTGRGGNGGEATFGFGSDAATGTGGPVSVTLTNAGALNASSFFINSNGTGGDGGFSNATDFAATRGGDGFGDDARITLDGGTFDVSFLGVSANGTGGEGGSHGSSAGAGGRGGDGFGGEAELITRNDTYTFDNVSINARGQGGRGGNTDSFFIGTRGGAGGDGAGGSARLTASSDQSFFSLSVNANGNGGFGGSGGTGGAGGSGRGGTLDSGTGLGGAFVRVTDAALTINRAQIFANGVGGEGATGGEGLGGFGGNGVGGDAGLSATNSLVILAPNPEGDLIEIGASGFGGNGGFSGSFSFEEGNDGANGGSGSGGRVLIDLLGGTAFLSGQAVAIDANGQGGSGSSGEGGSGVDAGDGGDGGAGIGGDVIFTIGGGSTLAAFDPVRPLNWIINAFGQGGDGNVGGDSFDSFGGAGGAGGGATGGTIMFDITGGSGASFGAIELNAEGTAGEANSGGDGALGGGAGGRGANAIGGTTTINIVGGAFSAPSITMDVDAEAGDGGDGGIGTGIGAGDGAGGAGGDAFGGMAAITVDSTEFNVGGLDFGARGVGGDGGFADQTGAASGGGGGVGRGGTTSFSAVSLSGSIGFVEFNANGQGGFGGGGAVGGIGGIGRGGASGDGQGVLFELLDGTLSVDFLELVATGQGGRGGDGGIGSGGNGGAAFGGDVRVRASGPGASLSIATDGSSFVTANAIGGFSGASGTDFNVNGAAAGADGGAATGGSVFLDVLDGASLFAGNGLELEAIATAGDASEGESEFGYGFAGGDGGDGGIALGGTVTLTVGGESTLEGFDGTPLDLTIEAFATGGDGDAGGSSSTGLGGDGGAGGAATGGTIRFDITDGSLTRFGFLRLDTQAFAGPGRFGGNGSTGGGDGGIGGDGTGGQTIVNVTTSEFTAATLFAQGGGFGGEGGRAGFGSGTGAAGGDGASGGRGIGGGVALSFADADFAIGSTAIDVNGFGGGGGRQGFGTGIPGVPGTPGPPPVPPVPPVPADDGVNGFGGDGTGGRVAIVNTDTGVAPGALGRTLGDLSVVASGFGGLGGDSVEGSPSFLSGNFFGGRIDLGDTATAADGSLVLNSLFAEATGSFDAGDEGFFLESSSGPLVVTGDASVNTGTTAGFTFDGDGALQIGGALSVNADSFIFVTHSGQSSLTPADSISAQQALFTSFGSFNAAPGSRVRGRDTLDISVFGNVDAGNLLADNRITVRALGNITLQDALVGGAVTDPDGDGPPSGGLLELIAGAAAFNRLGFTATSNITLTGNVSATGEIVAQAGGDIIVTSGASVISDNRVNFRSGDDIIVEAGALVRAADDPLPEFGYGSSGDPLGTPALLSFDAGSIVVDGAPDGVASIIVAGTIAAPARPILLTAEAIQADGNPILSSSLVASIRNAPGLGVPGRDDDGALRPECVEGNICLGRLSVNDIIQVGPANRITLAGGDVTANVISLDARDGLTLGTTDAPSSFAAGSSLFLRSGLGDVTLNDITVSGPDFAIFAGGSVLGTGTLTSTGDVAISVGDSIVATAIDAGGALVTPVIDGAPLPGSIVAGDFLVGSVTTGTGGIAVDAGGDIDIGFASTSESVNLVADGAISVGELLGGATMLQAGGDIFVGTANVSSLSAVGANLDLGVITSIFDSDFTASGGSVAIDDITIGSGFSLFVNAGPGGIDIGAASAGGDIDLQSQGGVTAGTLSAGDDIIIDAIGAVALSNAVTNGGPENSEDNSPGSNIVITTLGAVDIATANAFNSATIDAGSLTVASTTLEAGDNVTVTTTGDADLGTTVAGGLITVDAGGAIDFASLDSGTATLLTAGGAITGGATVAGGVLVGTGASIAIDTATANSIRLTATSGGVTIGTGLSVFDFEVDAFGDILVDSGTTTGLDFGYGRTSNIDLFSSNGAIDVGAGQSTGSISLTAQSGAVTTGALTARNDILVSGAGDIVLGALAAGEIDSSFADVRIDNTGASDITVAAASATGNIVITGGATSDFTTPGALDAGGSIFANVGGGFAANGAIADGSVDIFAGGAVGVTTGEAGFDFRIDAGGDVTLGEIVTLGVDSGGEGSSNIDVTSNGAISIDIADAAENVLLDAAGGIDAGLLEAGNDILVRAGSAILIDTANATRDISIDDLDDDGLTNRGADLDAGALTAGDDIAIDLGGQAVIALARTTGAVPAGGVDVSADDGIAIERIDAAGAADLSSSNGGVLVSTDLKAGGAVTAFGDDIDLSAVGALTISEAVAVDGNLVAEAGGTLTLVDGDASGDIRLTSTGQDVIVGAARAGVDAGAAGPGDIVIDASRHAILNGVVVANRNLDITALGRAEFNAAATGQDITVGSGDIVIGANGRIGDAGTGSLLIENIDATRRTFIGGATTVEGYSLSADELGRLVATDITLRAPSVAAQGGTSVGSARQPDVIVGAFTLSARSSASGPGQIGQAGTLRIETPGKLRVNGAVALTNMGSGNRFEIQADDALEIVTDTGSIDLRASGGALGGTLFLGSDDVIAASADAIADVGAATSTDAIDDRLALRDGAVNDDGYLRAGGIEVSANNGFFVQNTGAGDRFSQRRGLTVGSGGLSIDTEASGARIVINGRQVRDAATPTPPLGTPGFVTGVEFLRGVTINGSVGGMLGGFDGRSTINGCLIGNPAGCIEISPVLPRDLFEDVLDPENDGEPGGSPTDIDFLTTLIQLRDFEPFGFEPLVDEPVTGAGNDDLYVRDCKPGSTEEGCEEAPPAE